MQLIGLTIQHANVTFFKVSSYGLHDFFWLHGDKIVNALAANKVWSKQFHNDSVVGDGRTK